MDSDTAGPPIQSFYSQSILENFGELLELDNLQFECSLSHLHSWQFVRLMAALFWTKVIAELCVIR